MEVLCLCQIFFNLGYVSWIASHLKITFHYFFYINMTLSRLESLCMLIFFFIYICLKICEEYVLLVKYLPCTMCIFLRNTGKHNMCNRQKSDIV